MTPQEEASVKLLREAYDRWEKMPPVALTISRMDAQAVLMALQGMVTHPGVTPRMAQHWEHIGRQIMEAICDTPEIYAMFQAGWNRDFDVVREPGEGQRSGAESTTGERDKG